jgi:uncharacterized protein YndB with AHSA1/START domain
MQGVEHNRSHGSVFREIPEGQQITIYGSDATGPWFGSISRKIAMDTRQLVKARVTRQFDVSPHQVFNAWIDSRTAGKWLFAAGRAVCVEIDARTRGWFYIVGRRSGANVEYVGEYVEVVRPHRLVFALLAEKYSLNFERVTVMFDPRGIGCELSLTHETKAEFVQQVRSDWIKLLDRLAAMFSQIGRDAPGRIAS